MYILTQICWILHHPFPFIKKFSNNIIIITGPQWSRPGQDESAPEDSWKYQEPGVPDPGRPGLPLHASWNSDMEPVLLLKSRGQTSDETQLPKHINYCPQFCTFIQFLLTDKHLVFWFVRIIRAHFPIIRQFDAASEWQQFIKKWYKDFGDICKLIYKTDIA